MKKGIKTMQNDRMAILPGKRPLNRFACLAYIGQGFEYKTASRGITARF